MENSKENDAHNQHVPNNNDPLKPITKNKPVVHESPVFTPKNSRENSQFWWANSAIAAIGLIGVFLPWISIRFFGVTLFSLSGLDIPNMALGFNDVPNAGSSFHMPNNTPIIIIITACLLYLIPLSFIGIIISELIKSTKLVKALCITILFAVVFFLVVIVIGSESPEVFQFLSYGILITLAAPLFILIRSKAKK